MAKKAKAILKCISHVVQKLKTVFGGRYSQQNINIEIKTSDNSKLQIVLKLKTVFGGKGQIQTTKEIQTEILEPAKSKSSMFNYDLKRLIH